MTLEEAMQLLRKGKKIHRAGQKGFLHFNKKRNTFISSSIPYLYPEDFLADDWTAAQNKDAIKAFPCNLKQR